MPDLAQPAGWLPLVFMLVMGIAILAYVVLDGYDLGVGILMGGVDGHYRDPMIATIAPFWDANETWLVLGVGVLLTAFPAAHGVILGALYLPVAAMLLGLILRGVAFDFRIKAQDSHKPWWNRAFFAGSLLAALAQGYMLGTLVTGFSPIPANRLFAAGIALGLPAGYCLLGACWLIAKAEGNVRLHAVRWARMALGLTALAIVAVSVVTPAVNREIFAKWFSVPNIFLLAPIPILTAVLVVATVLVLRRLPSRLLLDEERLAWVPFWLAVGIFVLAFHGLAYSLFPWLVPGRLDIWQTAAAPGSLMFILVGVAVVLPLIIAYSAFSYRVFRGRATGIGY
jgi:cytochrome d ubiquinol oxidase subunit II